MENLIARLFVVFFCLGIPKSYGLLYYDTSIPNKYVAENIFLTIKPNTSIPPSFDQAKSLLPEPYWPSHPDAIKCYWAIWEREFAYLHPVTPTNQFESPYLEPPFNGLIYMWDACFDMMFGNYGHRAFNFQASLDNFYCKQEKDGYICRAISMAEGQDFTCDKFNPVSTGPNLMPWAEWEYFLNFGDTNRLKEVFPPLLAYYQWYRTWRSWPDGSYFSSGWGCGMDNQPRLPQGEGFDPRFSTGFMSWVDITLQQIFVGKILVQMAGVLHREDDVKDVQTEVGQLTKYVQKNMWDEKTAFFYDRFRDGSLSHVKSIAGYWALLAGVVPPEDRDRFIAHLKDPKEFAREHRVPTLSADDPGYDPGGGYWCGAAWAPTTYMVLRGLSRYGEDSLAHEIALNDLTNVVKVFSETGTFWENYAPDAAQGCGMKNFVDWDGLIPINEMFEYVFGIRPDVPEETIVWDMRLLDEHGIKNYPFGKDGLVNLICKQREKVTDKPQITVSSNVAFKLKLIWAGGSKVINVPKTIN
jgi:hypothetical protein